MVRQRAGSVASENSSVVEHDQELSSMYDYLAKIVLLGPSGAGKSCLLHRFVKDEWRVLSSQTIGVEFASKIVKVGTGPSRKRIKLQLWDTAGTERFRSVSRSYYRGAAGALLIYDIASRATFDALPTFLNDARALASPNLTLLLVGNKSDLSSASSPPTTSSSLIDGAPPSSSSFHNQHHQPPQTPSSLSSKTSTSTLHTTTPSPTTPTPPHPPTTTPGLGAQTPFTTSAYGRAVPPSTASHWASSSKIAVSTEASALSGDNVDEVFARLARMILTKIELGEVDPDDPASGIQYGDGGMWWGGGGGGVEDGGSVKSGYGGENVRRRKGRGGAARWMGGMREWEDVFRVQGGGVGRGRKRGGGCC